MRTLDDARELLRVGADKVSVNTAAVARPELIAELSHEFGAQCVVVGVDVRRVAGGFEVFTHGGRKPTGLDAVARFEDAGVAAVIVTDIGRDGTLTGPDVDGLAAVLEHTVIDVIASGGVGSLDDLRALAHLSASDRRLAGVIVGKALYEGVFTVEEAIAACALSA